jgi:hypothetical protein
MVFRREQLLERLWVFRRFITSFIMFIDDQCHQWAVDIIMVVIMAVADR